MACWTDKNMQPHISLWVMFELNTPDSPEHHGNIICTQTDHLPKCYINGNHIYWAATLNQALPYKLYVYHVNLPSQPCTPCAITIPMLQKRKQRIWETWPRSHSAARLQLKARHLGSNIDARNCNWSALKSAPTENWIHSQSAGFFLK